MPHHAHPLSHHHAARYPARQRDLRGHRGAGARAGRLGHRSHIETPRLRLPVYTLQRLLFNRGLRPAAGFDLTVGFDMDGYRIAQSPRHVASLKGVIADEVRFERGPTKLTMGDAGALRAAARPARARG